MTEEALKKALKVAQEEGQIGLYVWSSSTAWDLFANTLIPKTPKYDFAFSQLKKQVETTIFFEFHDSAVIVIPVEKSISSNSYFEEIFEKCKAYQFKGPISLVPSKKLIY